MLWNVPKGCSLSLLFSADRNADHTALCIPVLMDSVAAAVIF